MVYLERDARFVALRLAAVFLAEPLAFEAPFLRAVPFLAACFLAGFLVAAGFLAARFLALFTDAAVLLALATILVRALLERLKMIADIAATTTITTTTIAIM